MMSPGSNGTTQIVVFDLKKTILKITGLDDPKFCSSSITMSNAGLRDKKFLSSATKQGRRLGIPAHNSSQVLHLPSGVETFNTGTLKNTQLVYFGEPIYDHLFPYGKDGFCLCYDYHEVGNCFVDYFAGLHENLFGFKLRPEHLSKNRPIVSVCKNLKRSLGKDAGKDAHKDLEKIYLAKKVADCLDSLERK